MHSRWGNDITVLLGDYLYIKSMAMALTQDALEIIRLLCDVTLRMIEGELYQLTKNGDVDITEDEHFEIIRRKTAYLFGGCAQIGGMLGSATTEQQQALREYGFNLGMAFQLVDDLLDFTAEETGARQAGRRRPARRQGDAAAHPAAASAAGLPPIVSIAASSRIARVTTEQWREIVRAAPGARAPQLAYAQGHGICRAGQEALYVFAPSSRTRRAAGAARLRPVTRQVRR